MDTQHARPRDRRSPAPPRSNDLVRRYICIYIYKKRKNENRYERVTKSRISSSPDSSRSCGSTDPRFAPGTRPILFHHDALESHLRDFFSLSLSFFSFHIPLPSLSSYILVARRRTLQISYIITHVYARRYARIQIMLSAIYSRASVIARRNHARSIVGRTLCVCVYVLLPDGERSSLSPRNQRELRLHYERFMSLLLLFPSRYFNRFIAFTLLITV